MPSDTYTTRWRCPCGAGFVALDVLDYGKVAYAGDWTGRFECASCPTLWQLHVSTGFFEISRSGGERRKVDGFLERA